MKIFQEIILISIEKWNKNTITIYNIYFIFLLHCCIYAIILSKFSRVKVPLSIIFCISSVDNSFVLIFFIKSTSNGFNDVTLPQVAVSVLVAGSVAGGVAGSVVGGVVLVAGSVVGGVAGSVVGGVVLVAGSVASVNFSIYLYF